MSDWQRIGVIGFGAITEELVRSLESTGDLKLLTGILVRPHQVATAKVKAKNRFSIFGDLNAFLDCQPHLVVEAAGHGAVASIGPTVLERDIDLMVASVGALADSQIARMLIQAAAGRSRLVTAGGAVAGIDGLLSARSAGLKQVHYTSLKPPHAWIGTNAEAALRDRHERHIFFNGTARRAASLYPQNANVAATVAFAGIGLDRTMVSLGSDPNIAGPLGIIEAGGEFGSFRFESLALASQTNPKTSMITGHSLAVAARDGICLPLIRPLLRELKQQ